MSAPKKKTITRSKMLELEGLLTLARYHNAMLNDIALAAAKITGEKDDGYGYFGLTTDAVYDEQSTAASLLKKLEIEVR